MGAQMNIPDKWVVIEVVSDKTKLHRVFACWYGGSVLNNLIAKSKEKDIIITVLPEDTNWKELIDDTNVTSRDNQTEGRE
jgi:hypothetical protein